LLFREAVETSTRRRLQKTRLRLCGAVAVAGLACADPLVGRLFDTRPEPAHTRVPSSWVRYVVQPGDTLGRIAACRRVSFTTLARVNQLPDPDRLPAGAALHVPPVNGCANAHIARDAAPPPHAEAEQYVAWATSAYDGADFEQALSLAEAGIRALAPHPRDPPADAIRARCHLVAGMAAAGLEQRERAIEEFRHALDLEPNLAVDPQRSSPRVVELVEMARSSSSASGRFVESSTR